jgi:hypothetical protein
MWLKRGLRCRKLHCPPRQVGSGREEVLVSDDVMIAVDPHKASNTAAVLDPGATVGEAAPQPSRPLHERLPGPRCVAGALAPPAG